MLLKIIILMLLALLCMVAVNGYTTGGIESLLLLIAAIIAVLKRIPNRQEWAKAVYREMAAMNEEKK